jgi:hypothetical protein
MDFGIGYCPTPDGAPPSCALALIARSTSR